MHSIPDYLCYLDGEYVKLAEARVSVLDRGFVFGDGVYEVTRVMRGKIFEEEGHWQRLQNGLRVLLFPDSTKV